MGILETFTMSLQNILSSKVRTLLTMLGIIIGVTAVILIVGLGNGLTGYMADSFSSLGTNTLTVTVLGRGTSRNVSVEQMYDIVDKNDAMLEDISPTVTMSGQLKVGNTTYSSTAATGVSESYLSMRGYNIAAGRDLNYIDMTSRKKVCVVGQYVNLTYFNGAAVGQELKFGSTKLRIVGVMEQQDDNMEEGGTDDCLYLPYTTASRLSYGEINSYTITMKDENQAEASATIVENALYEVFQDDDAYMVVSMSELLDTLTSMVNVLIGVLVVIAGISLLVGGIGIMNIMLVSVTERTREIGIRKALGAREGVILRQFVFEAALTSAIGGLFGIGIGYGLSAIATRLIRSMTEYTITVSPSYQASLIAFGISAGIGILFGYLPARKAARLNPIDALRYD